jgi:hypothetical protein
VRVLANLRRARSLAYLPGPSRRRLGRAGRIRGLGDIADTGSDFTVDLITQAQNASGNQLSASHGYRTGLDLPPATAFGPGKPDPDVPGLVVTLCTTPAGGPNANLAGEFQLKSVSRHEGLTRFITGWEVG